MVLPKNIAAYLQENPVTLSQGLGDDCQGAKFHSPKPLQVQRALIFPVAWGGHRFNFDGIEYVRLCGTCYNNLRLLNEMMFAADGVVPWEVRREFGNDIRAIAQRGWNTWIERKS